jgi:hypothetical protein
MLVDPFIRAPHLLIIVRYSSTAHGRVDTDFEFKSNSRTYKMACSYRDPNDVLVFDPGVYDFPTPLMIQSASGVHLTPQIHVPVL